MLRALCPLQPLLLVLYKCCKPACQAKSCIALESDSVYLKANLDLLSRSLLGLQATATAIGRGQTVAAAQAIASATAVSGFGTAFATALASSFAGAVHPGKPCKAGRDCTAHLGCAPLLACAATGALLQPARAVVGAVKTCALREPLVLTLLSAASRLQAPRSAPLRPRRRPSLLRPARARPSPAPPPPRWPPASEPPS